MGQGTNLPLADGWRMVPKRFTLHTPIDIGETTMLRSLTVVLMLLLGTALPAAAQKADSESEQALHQSIETICREWEAAIARQDSTAVAALFTADGTFVTPAGVLPDRQAIKTF